MTKPWPVTWNFKKHEFTNPDMMNLDFMAKLDELRRRMGCVIRILRGAETEGHGTQSAHYDRPCSAVDIQVTGESLPNQGRVIKAVGFEGVGFYPQWTRGGHPMPGWHLDDAHAIKGIRPRPWRWVAVKDYEGKQRYVAL